VQAEERVGEIASFCGSLEAQHDITSRCGQQKKSTLVRHTRPRDMLSNKPLCSGKEAQKSENVSFFAKSGNEFPVLCQPILRHQMLAFVSLPF
jgi:hypothetical protein